MPNIIEQQDLLKGLPDARLASLMQNPNADMPPFLVAAEAQRRQAIRQQFTGSGSNESVVDSLTKQMANVPQNLRAPAQTPPQMPPPQPTGQEAAGIGALNQPQQMANGGPVRRFAANGFVTPTVSDLSSSYYTDPLSGGDPGGPVDTSGISSFFTESIPKFVTETIPGAVAPILQRLPHSPVPTWHKPPSTTEPTKYGMTDADRRATTSPQYAPRKPEAGQENTSPQNQEKPAEDEIRKRLEALYATNEPSSWENAQKWFAMSAQFLDPHKTLMQSLAGAGSEYAGANAEQARAQRDDARAREEALLKYDIGTANTAKEDALAAQQNKAAILKGRTDVATGQLDDLYRQQRDLAERARRIDESIAKGEILDPAAAQAEKQALTVASDRIGAKISTFEGFLGQAYGFPTIPTVDMAAGTIK